RRTNAAGRDDAGSRGKCQRGQVATRGTDRLVGKCARDRRSAFAGIAEGQCAADRKNARDRRRTIAGNTREATGRIVQAGERAIGKGAPGARRDAATGERCRRIATSADQRESARGLGRSAAGSVTRAIAHLGTIRSQCANAGRKRRTRGLCDQIAGRREWRSSVVADRRQISDRRLSATNYGTGKRRLSANRRRNEGFGNAAQKIGERYLREIY